jgi:hypothetical protein
VISTWASMHGDVWFAFKNGNFFGSIQLSTIIERVLMVHELFIPHPHLVNYMGLNCGPHVLISNIPTIVNKFRWWWWSFWKKISPTMFG